MDVTSDLCHGSFGPPSLPGVRKGRPLTAVALLALAAVGAGCSGHPESATPSERGKSSVPATVSSTLSTAFSTSGSSGAPGTTSGTTPPRFSAEQQAVIEAHDRGMRAYQAAATASDPSDPALKDSFAPQFLRETQIRIQQRLENGQAVRDAQPSKARTSYVTVNVTPPTAALVTCEVDDRVVYRVADGTAVNAKVTTDRWSVAMTDEDGTWKISGRHQIQTWDGEEMDACLGAQSS